MSEEKNIPRTFTPTQLNDLVNPNASSGNQNLATLTKELTTFMKEFNGVLTNIKTLKTLVAPAITGNEERSESEIIESKIEKGAEQKQKNAKIKFNSSEASSEIIEFLKMWLDTIDETMTVGKLKEKIESEFKPDKIKDIVNQFVTKHTTVVFQ